MRRRSQLAIYHSLLFLTPSEVVQLLQVTTRNHALSTRVPPRSKDASSTWLGLLYCDCSSRLLSTTPGVWRKKKLNRPRSTMMARESRDNFAMSRKRS